MPTLYDHLERFAQREWANTEMGPRPEIRSVEAERVQRPVAPVVETGFAARAGRMSFGGAIGVPRLVQVPVLLRWGRQAARSGDRLAAHRLFAHAVDLDPAHEEAWLWRAGTSDKPEEVVGCLERVLEINSGNQRARRGLEQLRRRSALEGTEDSVCQG
jgi:hypothetical protein